MSSIIEFYRGGKKNAHGVTLEEIWDFSLEKKEAAHNYIQWLFPTKEKSAFNPAAPTLTDRDIEIFRGSEELKSNLQRSFWEMMKFYGFAMTGRGGYFLLPSQNFEERRRVWLTPGNHNFLRLTRMLKSLGMLGLELEAKLLFIALCSLFPRSEKIIGETTKNEWVKAVRDLQ